MRTLPALATLLAALTLVPAASPDPMRYGIADDWPKFHPCGDAWWGAATDIGYQDLRMTVQWDETQPGVIPFAANLQAAVECAVLANVRPILAIYPMHPAAIGSNVGAQQQFAAFVALVGTAFPAVTNFIVGNEPNVNRFWQPQYVAGHDAAATDYEHTLAASYDALKAVRPDALVWGPAISSRGNDDPYAASNPSHSPIWFIKDLGDAYRASGRTAPIFDEFDLHPYPPVQDTAPFSQPFPWPQVGAANLDRVKQALWDAFHGTAQPVPAEYGGGRTAASGLPIDLDEVGEQTTVGAHEAVYANGAENVAPIDQATQAARYVELARIGACDPDVKTIMWFPLVDETNLSGFQSGQLYADFTPKASYTAMKQEIATARGRCVGAGPPGIVRRWVHTTSVVGAAVAFAGPGTGAGSKPRDEPSGVTRVVLRLTTGEDASYTASLVQLLPGARQPAAVRTVATVAGLVHAYHRPPVTIRGRFADGRYRIRVVVTAATNPARTTTITSGVFRVGPPRTGT